MLTARGYVTPKEFGGLRVPIPAQNIVYRHYSSINNYKLLMPVYDINLEGKYTGFKELLDSELLPNIILFFSFLMFQENNCERNKFLEDCVRKGIKIICIIDNFIIVNDSDIKYIDTVFKLRNIQCNFDFVGEYNEKK